MKIDMESQGYWYDDVLLKKEDKLLSMEAMKKYLDDGEKAAQLAALGCLIMNIIYQGDEAKGYDLMMNGDPRSDWVSLHRCTGEYKEVRGRKVRPSRKNIEQAQAFNLLLDGCLMMDMEISPDMEARLDSEEPSLIKCLLAGLCARMDLEALSQMVLIPSVDRIVSVIMQLRQ